MPAAAGTVKRTAGTFWDELFIFPFLTLRLPMLTRALLRYRYRRLPEARRAAQAAGYAGAMPVAKRQQRSGNADAAP